jgi:hypothetical protein
MILAGRDGNVKWDPAGGAGAAAADVISISGFTLSMKVEKIPVTCFLDLNRVYVPGLPDISGDLSGFYNSADLTLFEASRQTTPGWLELIPHTSEGTTGPPVVPYAFKGLAYLDAELDTNVEGAPALSGSFVAAGPWEIPDTGALARGARESRESREF